MKNENGFASVSERLEAGWKHPVSRLGGWNHANLPVNASYVKFLVPVNTKNMYISFHCFFFFFLKLLDDVTCYHKMASLMLIVQGGKTRPRLTLKYKRTV